MKMQIRIESETEEERKDLFKWMKQLRESEDWKEIEKKCQVTWEIQESFL